MTALDRFLNKKNDILMFFECLQLSENTACCQKSRCDRIVALCILSKERFSYLYRCKDVVLLLGRNPTELRWIFILKFILFICHHHRLESWNLYFLQPPYLERYADAVAGKGALLCNCFDFVDGTIARICRHV